MFAGACAAILFGCIGAGDAVRAVDPDVMLFLLGMFVVGEAVCASGYLEKITGFISQRCETANQMLLFFILMMGGASAILMNDTIAIIGTPLVFYLAARYRIAPEPLLLTLCFALTTGSVISPIGNPQNLLVASYWNRPDPFQAFFSGLIIPTLISLALVYLWMRIRSCREEFGDIPGISTRYSPGLPGACTPDPTTVCATKLSLLLLLVMMVLRIGAPSCEVLVTFPLSYIAITAAVPVLLISRQRTRIFLGIDWRTLVFFASLFILMQSVYDSGWFQESVPFSSMTPVPMIYLLGIFLSQFISNVPFVALFQPVIFTTGISGDGFLALAAGSTIAGNLTILGAASNVIVLQQAEKHGIRIRFLDFIRAGVPLTIMQSIVYLLWFSIR